MLAGKWTHRLPAVGPDLAVAAKCERTPAFGRTEAWGRVRPGPSSGKWCSRRRGLQGDDWRLGVSVRVLTGTYCQQVVLHFMLALFAKQPPGLVL